MKQDIFDKSKSQFRSKIAQLVGKWAGTLDRVSSIPTIVTLLLFQT